MRTTLLERCNSAIARARRAGAARIGRALGGASGERGGVGRWRRGSILVLVVGTMGLMALLAVLYTSIGASDRRTARGVEQRVKVDEVPAQVREYVGDVLARDMLSVFPAPAGFSGGQVRHGLRRETWDYPWTDPMMQSQPGGSDPASSPRRFRPEGSYPVWPTDAVVRASLTASDPWLASEDPANLALDSGDQTSPGDLQRWQDSRDWAQMSNFAPDGRAVNLYNLRNNFDAEPGFGTDADGLDRMSEDLSIYDEGGSPTGINGAPLIDFEGPGDGNVPAHLFTNQRFAVRAVEDDAGGLSWDDLFFPRYQYADADGDGMMDSRWQELIDATDPNAPESLIEAPEGFRFFFAFRAVDLSARANVNTAIDFTVEPEEEFRAGRTPGDVDLRRLLSLEDPETVNDPAGSSEEWFDLYDMLDRPRDASGNIITNTNDPRFFENYVGYEHRLGSAPEPRPNVGDRAYDYLRYALERGVIPPAGVFAEGTSSNEPLADFDQSNFVDQGVLKPTWYSSTPGEWEPNAEGRSILYGEIGAGRLGASFDDDDSIYANSFSLGEDSLLDLLTYNGVNDPDTLSPLEAIVGGRFADSGNADDLSRRFDPLRSNRSLAVERDRDRFDIRGETTPDGVTDLESYAHMLVDVRHRLTTLSGARPLRSTVVVEPGASMPLDDEAIRASIASLRASERKLGLGSVTSNAQTAFDLYRDALAPLDLLAGDQTAVDAAWDESAGDWPNLRTLFYGYRGADTAVRMAAHMAVNLQDLGDGESNTSPDARTLRFVKGSDTTFDPAQPWVINQTVDPDNARLLTLDDLEAPAQGTPGATPTGVNIYGVEPQPFITEVGTMFVYTDAPIAAGGDDEPDDQQDGGDFGGGPVVPWVTMNSDIEGDNEDFLLAALAIQITNPFDVSLTDDLQNYYVELRTRTGASLYYQVLDTEGGAISLAAGGTTTLVLLSHSTAAAEQRFQAVDSDGVLDAGFIGTLLRDQFTDGTSDPIMLPAAGLSQDTPGGSALMGIRTEFADGSAFEVDQVRLWRTVGSNVAQHLMADRFHVPVSARLDRALDLPNDDQGRIGVDSDQFVIPGAVASSEDNPSPANFNQGLTVVTWARARRPEDPQGASARGQGFPAWALEARWAPGSLNDESEDALDPLTDLDDSDFPDMLDGGPESDRWTFRTIEAFATSVLGAPASELVTVDQHPDDKDGTTPGNNRQGIALQDLRAEMYTTLGEDMGGSTDPELAGIAGLLLPLAIGPELDPGLDPNATADDEWLTLSEALALALNYDNPPDGQPGTPFGVYAGLEPGNPLGAFGAQPTGWPNTAQSGGDAIRPNQTVQRGVVDRGHLVLDDFVPFFDSAQTGENTDSPPRRFNPLADTAFGLGLTPAMRILGSVDPRSDEFAGAGGVVPGLVNINTATRPVVRAIPMLSPSRDFWWWDTTHDDTTDIATTLVNYRDLVTRLPRPSATPSGTNLTFSFDGMGGGDIIPTFPVGTTGRQIASVISGLRHDSRPGGDSVALSTVPGLRSVGELLAARIHNADQGYSPSSPSSALHNIDRLGRDNSSVDRDGVDVVRYDDGIGDDDIDDDFDEQLAVLNAALGTMTDRTDYVAVWFLMHGYRESDVTGLDPEDPLVPTIARRYLMVVDRSNVESLGDKPEIVFFEEVPM